MFEDLFASFLKTENIPLYEVKNAIFYAILLFDHLFDFELIRIAAV